MAGPQPVDFTLTRPVPDPTPRAKLESRISRRIREREPGFSARQVRNRARMNAEAITGALGHFMQNEGQSLDEAVGSLRQLVEARRIMAGGGRRIRAAQDPRGGQRSRSRTSFLTQFKGMSEAVARVAASEDARTLDDAGVARLLNLRDLRKRQKRPIGAKPPAIR